ncbi:DUF503 domain-containing protein [Alkalibacterium sp. MB6]|uniref:DUF503 domain-containing protein n=1 Tax=Alkalibacterium sp. MB6 TaxID=2081965 RepID=UPI001379692F|nr:DUF503 domain-containing protein [Alkalibacterium sp. MB6]
MIVMGLEFTIVIYDSYSLKDKRSTVKSILHRTQNRHHLSTAEVGDWDMLNKATLAFGVVGSDRQLMRKRLELAVKEIEDDYEIEVITHEWVVA